MNTILFDDNAVREDLLPFTYTRPVSLIRIGILTIKEKWERHLSSELSFHTIDYLSKKFPIRTADQNLFINGAICPDENLVNAIQLLKSGQYLLANGIVIAIHTTKKEPEVSSLKQVNYNQEFCFVDKPWKIFQYNASQIRMDFDLITEGRKSKIIEDEHTKTYHLQNIFLEEGALVKGAILNAEAGPIYLGKNSQVQEGALIRGPFALCENSSVNMGAKIRGDSTIGPHSKVGGEISNVVIFGYSNKGHDGFLGNSVIGEWCNLGADTNNSNLKNNYENVKVWSYRKNSFIDTGLQFCGLMMGDHTKCGINTMFNTGTIVGVGANIFGDGFPRTFIPSFAWGGASGFTTFQLKKMLETATKVMERRNVSIQTVDQDIISKVFELSAAQRVWVKK